MNTKEEEQVTPTGAPSSRKITIQSYPRAKQRKLRGTKIKLAQIPDKPPEPESRTEILGNALQIHGQVLYDRSEESRTYQRKRPAASDVYDNATTKSPAMLRAQEIQSTLEATFPSFAKALVRSNVHVGFWMHLPMQFCKSHLPRNDTTIFLENEIGEEFIINYIAERTALSGGWKAFCAGNKLREGDVLIFHLVQPLRFKVYIVKGNDSAKVDGDLGHLSLDAQQNQINNEDQTEEDIESCKAPMPLRVLPVNILQEKLENQENSSMLLEANVEHAVNQSENENEVHVSKTLALTTSTGSTDDFKDMNGIKNFSIVVNGLDIDSELSDHHRTKYYELCCSQNSFLHKSILNSINHKLAAEIIIGTVNISEAIKASKLSTLHADYAVWDKTLKGFELLGMNVGFLCTRLERLMILAVESEEAMQTESREARHEQARVDEEMKNLELKLLKLRETRERLDTEIDALKESAESHEHKFQEVVNAPW